MRSGIKLVSLGCLAISSFAFADNHIGLYVGVKGGYNDMNSPKETVATKAGVNHSVNITRDDFVANAHIGYLYHLNSMLNLGGQFGYSYYGKYRAQATGSSSGSMSRRVESINAQAVVQLTKAHYFLRLRGGSGYFKADEQGSITTSGTTVTLPNKDKWQTIAGANIGYQVTQHVDVSAFYDHVFGETLDSLGVLIQNGTPKMDAAGLAIEYNFA